LTAQIALEIVVDKTFRVFFDVSAVISRKDCETPVERQ
jgi:hypothetical protein